LVQAVVPIVTCFLRSGWPIVARLGRLPQMRKRGMSEMD